MRTLVSLLALAGATSAAYSPMVAQMQRHLVESQRDSAPRLGLGPKALYHTTKQDHYDPSNTNTWEQAYYMNATYYKPGGDVFVCVGGEGPPLTGASVVASVHCNLAVEWLQETGAMMFAVQHRYYGCQQNATACPVRNPYTNMQYLSSRQAIADLADFHAFATKEYGLTGKWVSFGGSYPGMVASFFRQKYPHLVWASVASSAPVEGILDMQGYNDVVAAAYSVSDNDVGGSPACEDNIRDGHAKIGDAFTTDAGRQRLASLFGHSASWYANKNNQKSFASNGVAYFPAQGNDPTCMGRYCNIKKICAVMTDNSLGDNIEKLAHLTRAFDDLPWKSFDDRVEGMQQVVPEGFGFDFWTYQTCTEWGYYQTCETGSRCFYTQGLLLLPDFTNDCRNYGVNSDDEIAASIKASNEFYGARNPDTTCIVYVNGEVDPWRSQSILKSPGASLPVLEVAGASHHAWTHPSAPTDQKSVVEGRQAIREQVTKFLAQPDCLAPAPQQ